MSLVVLRPDIQNATITPNPVAANTSYLISVKVMEIEVVIEAVVQYCGTFASGEEVI